MGKHWLIGLENLLVFHRVTIDLLGDHTERIARFNRMEYCFGYGVGDVDVVGDGADTFDITEGQNDFFGLFGSVSV